mgnify:CR=1 FL=1
MTAYSYYNVEPPTKWQAGTSGEARVPFYFDCADCGADEPEIAGVIAPSDLDHAPTFQDVGIMRLENGLFKSAMFCQTCYAERLEQAARRK